MPSSYRDASLRIGIFSLCDYGPESPMHWLLGRPHGRFSREWMGEWWMVSILCYYGLLWIIMDYYGLLWIIMDYYGLLWIIMAYYGLLWIIKWIIKWIICLFPMFSTSPRFQMSDLVCHEFCKSRACQPRLSRSLQNRQAYCARHGYGLVFGSADKYLPSAPSPK